MATQAMHSVVSTSSGEEKMLHLEYNRSISRFSVGTQDTQSQGIISASGASFEESYRNDEFVNAWGKKLSAWEYIGAQSRIRYPGVTLIIIIIRIIMAMVMVITMMVGVTLIMRMPTVEIHIRIT